jgi:hypothetical protein
MIEYIAMEEEMKVLSLAIFACAAPLVLSTTAEAQQCSAQIAALQRQLSAPSIGTPGESDAMSPGDPLRKQQNVPLNSPPSNAAAARAALDHARQLDQAGREAECQAEVIRAKTAFGAQ